MVLRDEIRDQIQRAGAGIPWVLGTTTGEITRASEVSTEELIHGQQILIEELVRVVERLAGEIDKLTGH